MNVIFLDIYGTISEGVGRPRGNRLSKLAVSHVEAIAQGIGLEIGDVTGPVFPDFQLEYHVGHKEPLIEINERAALLQRRVAIARALGYLLAGPNQLSLVVPRLEGPGQYRTPADLAAYRYASELLVPMYALQAVVGPDRSVAELAEIFKVPEPMLTRRVEATGYFSLETGPPEPGLWQRIKNLFWG